MHLEHTSDLVRDDDLSFMVGPTERWSAAQLGRAPVLGTGDGVLMWNAEVGSMTLPTETRFTTFRVPVAAIEPRAESAVITGRRVTCHTQCTRRPDRTTEPVV